MTDYVVENISMDPRPSYPLQILATKYTQKNPRPVSQDGDEEYTLIFLHATGMHKETWEVMIARLFALSRTKRSPYIHEMYSIECPNHGESALLNEDAIEAQFKDTWPTNEYSRAAQIFLTAGLFAGARVDFSRRKLVGIGHSIGAAALFLMKDLSPPITFQSMIAFEPPIMDKELPETPGGFSRLAAMAWLRQDVWLNRKAAKKQLASSPAFKPWDTRVLDLYVRYGLRQHPAATKYKPPFTFNGVTTSLTKEQEAAVYRCEQVVVEAMQAYARLTREIPLHLVWGERADLGTPELKRLLSDPEKGRTPTSVTYIDDAGHLVVQQKPDQVAEVVCALLSKMKARL